MAVSLWIASRAYREAAYSKTSPALRLETSHRRFLHSHIWERSSEPIRHLAEAQTIS